MYLFIQYIVRTIVSFSIIHSDYLAAGHENCINKTQGAQR